MENGKWPIVTQQCDAKKGRCWLLLNDVGRQTNKGKKLFAINGLRSDLAVVVEYWVV